jgi:hypothetical protein
MKRQDLLAISLCAVFTTIMTATNALSCPNLNESQVLELTEPIPAKDSYTIAEPTQERDGSCSYALLSASSDMESASSDMESASKEGLLKIKLKPGLLGTIFGVKCPSLSGFNLKFQQPIPRATPYVITTTENKCNFKLLPTLGLEEKSKLGSMEFTEKNK